MAEQLRVMISSTARDLPEHRQKVMDACMTLGMFYPDMMEHLTATDANALDVSLGIVDRADLYVGVFAFRYGYIPPGQTISVTEAEYNRAVERDVPRLIFLMSDKHPVLAADVETGEGAEKIRKLKDRLKEERVVAFFDSPSDLEAQVSQALIAYRTSATTVQDGGVPQPLIHTLPTQQEIEGRNAECATILRAMSAGEHRVYAFAAPGGFGKTALLAKVVRTLSEDGETLLESVALVNGETIEPRVAALLHIDCRNEVKVSALFANAGKLIGQEQAFEQIYNSEALLPAKLQEIFSRLSAHEQKRTWFLFDNFESMLNEKSEVANPELRAFFSALFSGEHKVRALIVSREVPKFSQREQVAELETVGGSLFEGLPLEDCIEFLKKNGAEKGLGGSTQEIDAVLKEFANRVHRIPLALVWAVGYLRDTGFTLKQVLGRQELFADFDKEQGADAERYENKGLKRLHYEQLKIQPAESLPLLTLLAFFKRPVPKGAFAHLLGEVELSRTLTRLERNKLVTRKESEDAYTRYLNDELAVRLYGLHPVICENEFFDARPAKEELYETAANECWSRAYAANEIKRFAYGMEVYDCGEKLFAHLTMKLEREDLLNSYASMLMNKGIALANLTRLGEAIAEFDKAIAIRERLVNEEQQTDLANGLAMAYMNKGNALQLLTKLAEAIAEYDKAIAIYERLVKEEQQTDLANGLAMAYMNKGVALQSLTKSDEAIVEYDKAIAIYERLVKEEQQVHLVNDLAMAYMNKGNALQLLTKSDEAIVEYDKAIAIRERLVKEEQQVHLVNDLAMAYMNKGNALRLLTKSDEAIVEYDKAIAIRERLVKEEQQTHLANDLAMAYMNKGNALWGLTKLGEAIVEYDKAIAIREQLVNEGQQTHLANDLALAYMNKALSLEKQEDFDGALSLYEKSLQAQTVCLDELKMFWIMPQVLSTLRCQLMTLLNLQRWTDAAKDVLQVRTLFTNYINSDSIDDDLKKAAGEEFARMISMLHGLELDKRELLFVELGEEGEAVRSLLEG